MSFTFLNDTDWIKSSNIIECQHRLRRRHFILMFLLLVILFKLVSEFTNLLQCDVSVSYLTQNSKIIKEICKELEW